LGVSLICALLAGAGCRSGSEDRGDSPASKRHQQRPVRRVVCLFDQRPWLNADAAGDRDPEGIQFRVFLDEDRDKGVLRNGTLHVEMYVIEPSKSGAPTRRLMSDWHIPTSELSQVKANILGMGYHVRLRWAEKATAGHEIEMVTKFEDTDGRITRAGTTRRRVPKYGS
jgi:hypothetical protein